MTVFICVVCESEIHTKEKLLIIEHIKCPICSGSVLESMESATRNLLHPAEITMEEMKLPWACCAGKIPHGESCPVCGDKE